MITSLKAFKEQYVSNFKNELDEHVLAFFIKYGPKFWDNEGSVYEYIQNNSEDDLNDENVQLLLKALAEAMKKHESKEKIESINSDEYEIDQIIDIITDVEELKKIEEGSGKNLQTTNLTYKSVDRNDIIWITCMLKPRNSSSAYPMGEMGVIKCKVLETFYGLTKLKQLKSTDKII